jgi:hypothetical protein
MFFKSLHPLIVLAIHWLVFGFVSALVVSTFSCYNSWQELWFSFANGFHYHNFTYFRLTLFFFLLVAAVIAVPGYVVNALIYHHARCATSANARLLSVACNMVITAVAMGGYYLLHISPAQAFARVIAPVFVASAAACGLLLLPALRRLNQ